MTFFFSNSHSQKCVGTSGNVYYEPTPLHQRVNDVRTKGISMLKKVHGVINSKISNQNQSNLDYASDYNSDYHSDMNSDMNSDYNSDCNYNSDFKSDHSSNYKSRNYNSNYNDLSLDSDDDRFLFNGGGISGIGGMSGFAMRFSNVWRKNIAAASS